MYKNIESLLLDKYRELYLSIKRKSIEELKLPIKVDRSIIGFGKYISFFMFWIVEREGKVYFCARREFKISREENLVNIELDSSNIDAIFHAIDNIYASFLTMCQTEEFELRVQMLEDRRAMRKIVAKNKENPPEIELLWNDVTVFTFENAEKGSYSYSIDPEFLDNLKIQGERIIQLFDSLFQYIGDKYYVKLQRKASIYREYIESDKTTLAEIAIRYDVSRERIRQIVKRIDDTIFEYFKRIMLFDNSEYNEDIKKLAYVFESIDYNVVDLFIYGFSEASNRKKQAVINLLFGKEFSQKVTELSNLIADEQRQRNNAIEKEQETRKAWENYHSKICFPSELKADALVPITTYEKEKRYYHEKRMCKVFKKFEDSVEVIENPDIVYYSSSMTDHRPDILLRLSDGTSVLVVVLPTINMAYIYNIKRCNELHSFCKANGYGYLIIDDRDNSIYDIKSRDIDKKLEDELDLVLEENGMIVWGDIVRIKEFVTVTNADIAAYVLKNKLHFTMGPFCIKRRY